MGTVIATRSEMRARRSRAVTVRRRGRQRFRSPPATRRGEHNPASRTMTQLDRGQSQEDGMPAAPVKTCPLCGLRFSNLPLLELHRPPDRARPGGPRDLRQPAQQSAGDNPP